MVYPDPSPPCIPAVLSQNLPAGSDIQQQCFQARLGLTQLTRNCFWTLNADPPSAYTLSLALTSLILHPSHCVTCDPILSTSHSVVNCSLPALGDKTQPPAFSPGPRAPQLSSQHDWHPESSLSCPLKCQLHPFSDWGLFCCQHVPSIYNGVWRIVNVQYYLLNEKSRGTGILHS